MESDLDVPIEKILGPHPRLEWLTVASPRNRENRSSIAQSMRLHGWEGLPLLVHDLETGQYQAWMGMHRLLAARDAGIRVAPVVIMRRTGLLKAGFSDFELASSPWEYRERLHSLADRRPYELMTAEAEKHDKRGF